MTALTTSSTTGAGSRDASAAAGGGGTAAGAGASRVALTGSRLLEPAVGDQLLRLLEAASEGAEVELG